MHIGMTCVIQTSSSEPQPVWSPILSACVRAMRWPNTSNSSFRARSGAVHSIWLVDGNCASTLADGSLCGSLVRFGLFDLSRR